MTLVDAGPLVAIIDVDDANHVRCKAVWKTLLPPLVTVWPAFTEAMYLLEAFKAQDALWELALRGALSFATIDGADQTRMRELMAKYRDLPMDLADAALVRVAERERCRKVFTLDTRDFRIYRPRGIRHLEILPGD
jgi:hypothetical protein